MMRGKEWSIIPTSMVTHEDRQKIVIFYHVRHATRLFLRVWRAGVAITERILLALDSGSGQTEVMLPVQNSEFEALWQFSDQDGAMVAEVTQIWKKPREWTLYAMISSHTDIGLHNPPYIQRANSAEFIDAAIQLCDETDSQAENDRYRYTVEGTWFWNNYGRERGIAAAESVVRNYVQAGKIGVCCGVAGNHIQTYGLEEMCRSAYERRRLAQDWKIRSQTLSMIDNNGLAWSLLQPYADAGYRNIIFAPNQWNPRMSTVWKNDSHAYGCKHNPDAGGGGSRIDVRYSSELPMVFDWESKSGERLTVWTSTQYHWGGSAFGIFSDTSQRYPKKTPAAILRATEERMWEQLALLEEKYPYDLWLFACYVDDQEPDRYVIDQFQHWNAKWKCPKLRTLGNPDEPFDLLRQRFGDQIPVLRGDITGGWYQHPLSVPELLAQKLEVDRALPIAEKWATVAGMIDGRYTYPVTDFRRAWDALLCNDEHSYGTSGYKGRRVYETWMQHRDWIERAQETAELECKRALKSIASHIRASEKSVIVFNPTAQERVETVTSEDGAYYERVTVPPFGYRTIRQSEFLPARSTKEKTETPPVVENAYYRLRFAENGSICSIFDKELGRELLDLGNAYHANELVCTRDNHKTFTTPSAANFEILRDRERICVSVRTDEKNLGCEILQTVTLPHAEKRIELDNRLIHARDLVNCRRYYRYLYYAFPFAVNKCRRLCHLNGTVAEYAKDVTGHGTDVYMAVNEWCCSENDDFGVALMMKDSQLTEFDHIHPDKTDYGDAGEGSQIFSYVANDWLQMHTPGGSHLDYRFRYAITSYTGGYRAAGVPQMAERYVTPVATVSIPTQDGDLPEGEHRFMTLAPDLRFLCLKRADDGDGIIARFYGESDSVLLEPRLTAEPSTVDERPCAEATKKGFITYRLGKGAIQIKPKEPFVPTVTDGAPAPIGSVYTGLITKPRAAAGENEGHLYLLWGASKEEDFSHYKLYRSEQSGFDTNEESFVADILPEAYCVGRYEDTDLKSHTCYYYRVCAVNQNGVCGEMSEEFSAFTKEEFADAVEVASLQKGAIK